MAMCTGHLATLDRRRYTPGRLEVCHSLASIGINDCLGQRFARSLMSLVRLRLELDLLDKQLVVRQPVKLHQLALDL
jgi:hypothetical protein